MSLDDWKKLLASVPKAIDRPFVSLEPMSVYQGPGQLTLGDSEIVADLEIEFRWEPSPEAHIVARFSEFGLGLPHSGSLSIPGYQPADVFFTNFGSSDDGRSEARGHARPKLVPDDHHEGEVEVTLTNFHAFVGDPVGRDGGVSKARIVLESARMRAEFDQVSQLGELYQNRAGGRLFVPSHHGRVSLSCPTNDWPDVEESIRYFFAFCRGLWVGPVLRSKPDPGEFKAECGAWTVSAYRTPESWFPVHQVNGAAELFSSFDAYFAQDAWKDSIRGAIQWYVSANTPRTQDEGIISTAICVELLSWIVLTQGQAGRSRSEIGSFGLESRLRALMTDRGIPVSIPEHSERASAAADTLLRDDKIKAKDVPALLRWVRNALVHPTEGKRRRLRELGGAGLWEVRALALRAVELSVLSLLGYSGVYVDRSRLDRWVGDVESVPWV